MRLLSSLLGLALLWFPLDSHARARKSWDGCAGRAGEGCEPPGLCGKVPGLGIPGCSDSRPGSTCPEGGDSSADQHELMSLGDWGELGRTQSQGAAARGPEDKGAENSGREGRELCFEGGGRSRGGGTLISSRESGMFGCKGVTKMKRLLHLNRAGAKKEPTRITFLFFFSYDAQDTPMRWVLSCAFYRGENLD